MRYLGAKHNLIPSDILENYKGDCIHQLFTMDYKEKDMGIFWATPDKDKYKVVNIMTGEHYLMFVNKLATKLEK